MENAYNRRDKADSLETNYWEVINRWENKHTIAKYTLTSEKGKIVAIRLDTAFTIWVGRVS